MPELSIVSGDLWDKVQSRFRVVGGAHQITGRKGLLSRALTSGLSQSNHY